MGMAVFPRVIELRQTFPDERVADLEKAVRDGVARCMGEAPLRPGAKVAITAGSRGIRHIADILRYTVRALRSFGCEPFLLSAMGSHGGGKKEGQHAVLKSLGITAETVGAPIIASDETTMIGSTSKRETRAPFADLVGLEGLCVYIAKEAMEADAVFVVNRIKAHTAFQGDYESGLMKMMAVGLGRAPGADSVHRLGAERMALSVPSIAACMLSRAPIWGGLAIVENGYDEPHRVEGIPAGAIPDEERRLLQMAKSLMPKLPVNDIDLCLVREMGKNYSGTGMDTNVIGRMRIHGIPEPTAPNIRYIGVLRLSAASHGNATGIGLADFATRAVADNIDWPATYMNCLTSGFTARAAMPIIARDDRDLLEKAMFALKTDRPERLRLAIVNNTLHLERLWVTLPIFEEIRGRTDVAPNIEPVGEPFPLTFGERGALSLARSSLSQ